MSNSVTSSVIGKIKQNARFEDWWESSKVAVPLFNNEKHVITLLDFHPENDPTFINETDQALENFMKLTKEDRNAISDLVYENCINHLNKSDYDEKDDYLRDIKNTNDVWNYVKAEEIYISRRTQRDNDIYIQLVCNCDWETKQGLQLVYKQGKKLTRISVNDGYLTDADALDIADEKDVLLSQFA